MDLVGDTWREFCLEGAREFCLEGALEPEGVPAGVPSVMKRRRWR